MSCGSPRAGRRRRPGCRWCSRDLLYVVGVGGDALADLVVGALHLGVVCIDVLAGEAEQLVVVGAFEAVPARAVDGSHVVLLVLGYAALMGFEGCAASRHSGQPSSRRRAERPAACRRRTASCA